MDPVILRAMPLRLDVDFLLSTWCPQGGEDDRRRFTELAREAQAIACPKAAFCIAFAETGEDGVVYIDGESFHSHVLRVNLEKVGRVFPYLATCGRELDEWAKSLQDPIEKFWSDAIMEEAVKAACQVLQEKLEHDFSTGSLATMNPGSLEDWPMAEQEPLFRILGEASRMIGVELSGSFLMLPVKSVSGLFFPSEEKFESCRLCPRDNCPNRRAQYDAELFKRKYRS